MRPNMLSIARKMITNSKPNESSVKMTYPIPSTKISVTAKLSTEYCKNHDKKCMMGFKPF